jgi:hypothetical protein
MKLVGLGRLTEVTELRRRSEPHSRGADVSLGLRGTTRQDQQNTEPEYRVAH